MARRPWVAAALVLIPLSACSTTETAASDASTDASADASTVSTEAAVAGDSSEGAFFDGDVH